MIPGVEKFADSSFNSNGDEDRNDSKKPENQKILEKRITELRKLNEQQLLAEIAALKERAYRYVTTFIMDRKFEYLSLFNLELDLKKQRKLNVVKC